ncbi:MAG: NUDIX domain-containing protein [Candidatus Kapaibacterium sp.]|jgi:8-oxo-dGTP diphosphatase
MKIKLKSLAYITFDKELLVFRQPDFPEAGIQVPKGTIEDGDTPEETIIREIEEETGMYYTHKPEYLGEAKTIVQSGNESYIEHRHFFHCPLKTKPAETWEHYEYHAKGKETPILFSFFWVKCAEADGLLIANQGELLHSIKH